MSAETRIDVLYEAARLTRRGTSLGKALDVAAPSATLRRSAAYAIDGHLDKEAEVWAKGKKRRDVAALLDATADMLKARGED